MMMMKNRKFVVSSVAVLAMSARALAAATVCYIAVTPEPACPGTYAPKPGKSCELIGMNTTYRDVTTNGSGSGRTKVGDAGDQGDCHYDCNAWGGAENWHYGKWPSTTGSICTGTGGTGTGTGTGEQ
jgi:hypothetical protein